MTRLSLDDFGAYGGHSEFDLRTAEGRPIVLCGGTNGAGKTTLFESIMLCLYGRQSFEHRISQKQYHEKMHGLIHRDPENSRSASEASVTADFQFAHKGSVSEYRVTRSWCNVEGAIEEKLAIYTKKDQGYARLDSVDESGWQMFIDRMMPMGVAKLFFFDGEKIQDIADFGDEQQYIRESFDMLLGLDLVRQLYDDIGVYLLRNSGGQTQKILDEIEQQTAEKTHAANRLEKILEKQTYVKAKMAGIRDTVRAQEARISKIGGEFARNREELTVKRSKLEAELEQFKKGIRLWCYDLLPLGLIPEQLEEVKKQMDDDEERIQNRFERDTLREAFDGVLDAVRSDPSVSSAPAKKAFVSSLERIMQDKIDSAVESRETMFDLSLSEMERIRRLIDSVNESCESDMKELAESHDRIASELEKTKQSLDSAPQDDEIGPALSEIAQTNRELGELEGELENLQNLEAQEKSMIVMLNSRIRTNIGKRGSDRRLAGGINIGPAIQEALDEYSSVLRRAKIELLQKYVLDGLGMLLHKRNFVESVSIDPDTFRVVLSRKNGEEITRNMLSKGELQMYATAIVWGLAKTSGRPLPFVIDTPLARLDEEHRENMVDRFYPFASHQTIIMSTNSEINARHYQKLKPYIAKSCVIRYDPETGRAMTDEGYFRWEGQHAIHV